MWGTTHGPNAAVVAALSATPIDRAQPEPEVRQPDSFDFVFDCASEQGFSPSLAAARSGEMLDAYGFSKPAQRGATLLTIGARLSHVWLWSRLPDGKRASFSSTTGLRRKRPEWFRADLEKLFDLLDRGTIRPRVAERIGLKGVPEAHRLLESAGPEGKIVICP
jgi:NADPH:quinone reductase-like Zn-dependent oxidoreductase